MHASGHKQMWLQLYIDLNWNCKARELAKLTDCDSIQQLKLNDCYWDIYEV